jgi:Ser/Thr protein kinase RdoA (MazF antagonist)
VAGEYAPEVVADLQNMVAGSLACWNLSPATQITLLNLSENATFGLSDAATGRNLVLRLHRLGYSSADEIRSELAWIDALRQAGTVETATPIQAGDGQLLQRLQSPTGQPSRYAVAFERLPGKEPDPGIDAERWFERLGELTARMHRQARAWALPPGFCRKRWDVENMVGANGHWGSWRAAAGLGPPEIAVLERTLALIASRLDRFGSGRERFGLVHADLRLANLLVEDDHLRIIDFDDCGFSWFIYDFAAAVSFIEHEPILPDLVQAWSVGYRRNASLSREDMAEIPTFVILRRILLTAWLASHAEVPAARQLGAHYTAGTVRLAQELLHGRFLTDVCGH